jgi:type I restriction enzyme S subunit
MSERPLRQLGDLTEEVRRGAAPTYVDNSPVLAIGQRCVTNDSFNPDHARPHDERVPGLQPAPGDVLLNSTGTGTIGRSCVFRAQGHGYIIDGHVTLVRPSPLEADGRYLNEVLRSAEGQRYLETKCFTGSTNQVELSNSELVRMPLPAPALEEQRRIAEILDTVDECIRATERVIAKLHANHEGLRQTLLSVSGGRHVTEARLDDLIDRARPVVYGILMPGDHVPGGVPVIKVKDIRNGSISGRRSLLHTSAQIDQQYARSRVRCGDVLFTIRGTVGRTAVVPEDLEGANITQDTARLAVGGVNRSYLLAAMAGERFKRFVEVHTIGQAVKGINLRELRKAPVLVMGRAEQEAIGAILDRSQERLSAERERLGKLVLLRGGLAVDLLSGQVRTVAA